MLKTKGVLLTDKVVQNPGNVVSNMDDEKVMLNIQNGKYYNLGNLGGAIWDQLEKPILISQIVTYLLEDYEVTKLECEKQVLSFIDSLHKEGLINRIK